MNEMPGRTFQAWIRQKTTRPLQKAQRSVKGRFYLL